VTLAELRAEVTRRFQAADADRDGAVTRAEFDAYMNSQFEVRGDSPRAQQMRTRMEEMRTRMFRVLDADADGRLTLAEVSQPAEFGFRMKDRDGDGAVAQDEMGRRGMHGRGDGPGRGPGMGPGPQR
jgi:Ca2+-binding EF-hand superfamily protein